MEHAQHQILVPVIQAGVEQHALHQYVHQPVVDTGRVQHQIFVLAIQDGLVQGVQLNYKVNFLAESSCVSFRSLL